MPCWRSNLAGSIYAPVQTIAGFWKQMRLLPREAALVEAGVEHLFPDWPLRSRRRAILDDLNLVGGSVHSHAGPPPLNFGQVLGTAYALEVSRLDAQVLLKRVCQSSDPIVTAATAFLSHGAGHHLWRSFLVMLERHSASLTRTLSSEKDVIHGACQAFALFARAAESIALERS